MRPAQNLAVLAAFLLPFIVRQATFPGDRRVWFVLGVLSLLSGGLLRRHFTGAEVRFNVPALQ